MKVIKITNLSKIYGFGDATTIALDDISVSIDKGEFVAIMGPSGSGKSTLLNLIGLLDTPTYGSYLLDGHPVANLSANSRSKIRREQIGFIFQSFNLLQHMTVIDNVALPLMYRGVGHVERLEQASATLQKLGLGDREYYMPNQLSGGQIQRVAIARALANNPSIILADEPTGNLDTKSSTTIMDTLKNLNKQGNTIIMVTHDANLAANAARIIHVVDGKIAKPTKPKTPRKLRTPLNKKKVAKTARTTKKSSRRVK